MTLFNDDLTRSPLDNYDQDDGQRSFDGWDPVGEDSWFDPWESLQEGKPQGELGVTAAEQRAASTLRERHRRVDLGIEQRSSYGLAGEFATGIGRSLFQTTKSTVNTVEELLGVHDDPNSLSYSMDQYLRTHQAGALGRGADTLTEKAVASIGEQSMVIAAILGTGIATGGAASALGLGALGTKSLVTAGTMTTMSAMTFGDNADGIRAAAGGRLDESTIFGLSVMSTLIQASLEAVIGPEALIGKTISLQAMAAAKKPLAEMFAIASKKTLFSGVKGFGASVFAESGTEAAQSIVQSMWEDIAEGPGVSMGKEEFTQAMTEALYAIPTAAVFGGFASISEHMVKSGIIQRYKKLESSKEAVTAGLDEKRTAVYHEVVDTAYAKFEENLSPKFGWKGARSISEILKETAYHWAANGGKAPEALIETFDVILSNTELSEAQIKEVRKITDPVERVKWMRNNVQGYREFEAQQIEEYRARGVDQQYQYDLNRFRNLFGEDFGADLVPLEEGLADAQAEQINQAAEGEQITEQEKEQDVVAIHAAALGRLNDLHQMAAEKVADLDIPGNANKRRVVDSITTETASRMFRAMSDPDADTSWIRPEAMKETLINMIALNNSRVPRVDAALFVNKISQTTETRGVGKTPLESVFMTEAIKTQTEGYYNSDELVEMGKKIAQNADAWDFIMRSDMKTHMIEVLHSRKAELELTAEQEAQLDNLAIEDAIIQSENEYGRSLTEQEVADIIDAADVGAFDAIIDRITRERELDNLAAEEAIRDSEEEYGRNLTEQEVQEIIDSLDIDGLDSIADIEAENFAERERLRIMKALQELPDSPGSGADTLDVGGKRRAAELEELRRARQEKIEVMMALRELPDLIESGDETGSRIFAHYDVENRRAIFYKNATAEDVLHEWFHHVDLNNLLPASMRADMNVQYGVTKQSTQAEKTEARERAARDFVTFIRAQVDGGTPGQDYPERLEDTFNYLHAVFAEEWHADKGFEVNGEQTESSSQGLPPPAGLIAAINSINTKMGDMLNQAKDNAKQRTLDLFNNPETRQKLEYTEALNQFNKDSAELALTDEQVETGKKWLAEDYGTGQQMLSLWSSTAGQDTSTIEGWANWYDKQSQDFRDNYDPYADENKEGRPAGAFDYWEARKIMPKKPVSVEKPTLKRIKDDFTLWSDFQFIANVNGVPVGVNLEEGMDFDKTWFYQRLDDPNAENVETSWEKDEKGSFVEEMIGAIEPTQVTESSNTVNYKPEVQAFFDGMFENATIEEHHKTLAKVLKRSLQESPPLKESGLYEAEAAVNMTDRGKLRRRAHLGGHDQFLRRLKTVMGNEAYAQWDRTIDSLSLDQLREVARMAETETTESSGSNVLTMGPNGTPFYHPDALDRYAAIEFDGAPYETLTEEQKQRVQSILSSVHRRAEKADLQKKAKARSSEKAVAEAKAELLKTTRVIGSVASDKRSRAGSGGAAPVRMTQRILSSVGKAFSTVNAWVESRFSDTFGLLRYLDDGNDVEGIYTRVLGDPLREMNKLANEAIIESDQRILENSKKFGAAPHPKHWSKTFSFGKDGVVLTLSEAIGIYMYTDRGRSKLDVQALKESNRERLGDNVDSIISDVNLLVENKYTQYVRYNGDGDYSYSDESKPGFTKTHPAMNYIKAQMDIMKWYHPMLDKVHFERTGKHLGDQLAPIQIENEDGSKRTYQRKYFMPGMRRGRQWSRGSAMADVFVENEEVRETIVNSLYPGRTYEQLTDAEQREVNRREDHYNDAEGIAARRDGGRKSDVVGFVQEKMRGARGPELILNAADVFETYRAQADIFRSKTKTLDYLQKIVESEEMQQSLRQTAGYDNADTFHAAIIEMVKRERFVNGKIDVETDFDRAVGSAKSKMMVAVLGFRASSMLMQTASGPRVLGEISAKDWGRFAANGAKIAKAVGSNTHRVADVLLSRHNVFTEGEVGEMFNRIKKNNPDIINRMVDPALQDVYSSRYRNTGAAALTIGKGSLVDMGMGGFRVMDMATVLNVYTTSYESKVRELNRASVYSGKKMSAEQIEVAANKFAADVVNRTQPGSGVTSRNLMQTARESYRIWYPFTGDTMKQFQYLRHDIVQPLIRAARDGGMKGLASALVTGQYGRTSVGKKAMFAVLLPMTMASLIRRRRLPEDEKEWALDMAAYTFGTIPIIGPIFQNAISNGYAGAENIAMAPFVAAGKSVTYFKKGEELKGVDQFLKAISTGTGAPLVLIPWVEKVCDEMIGSGQLAPEDETKVEEYLRLLSLRVAPLPSEED
jgi:hypothetical protein